MAKPVAPLTTPLVGRELVTEPIWQNYFTSLYREGEWTPILGGFSTTAGQTYTRQAGRYVKLGRFVMATGFVELSAKGTVSGIAMVGNLPFPAEPHTQGVPQPPPSIIFFNLGTAWASLTGLLLADTTTILLFGLPPAGGVSAVTLNAAADLTNTSAIGLTICYLAQD